MQCIYCMYCGKSQYFGKFINFVLNREVVLVQSVLNQRFHSNMWLTTCTCIHILFRENTCSIYCVYMYMHVVYMYVHVNIYGSISSEMYT